MLSFSGVVSPSSLASVLIYSSATEEMTAFDGQPVDLAITVSGDPGALYVSSFTAKWATGGFALPFIQSDVGAGFPNTPDNDFLEGFYSTVDLNASGGAIRIFPTAGYVGDLDADVELNLAFTYASPHDPLGDFTDSGLSGGGAFHDFKTFLIDPTIGPYDAESSGDFVLSNVTQRVTGVPEPPTWAVMLLGLGSLGVALRAQRSRRQA